MIGNKLNNQPELNLIESLREAVSKELKIQVSNKKLGTLLISANRFNRIIREHSSLKRNSLDKIERNAKSLIKNEKYKKIALKAIENYRYIRGYATNRQIRDWPEYNLIKELKNIYRKAKSKTYSISSLSRLFGSKNLFVEAISKNSKFRNVSIKRVERKIKNSLNEPYLSEGLNVLNAYRERRGLVRNLPSNRTEDQIMKILQNIFSDEFDYLISFNELSQKFGTRTLINEALRKETVFVNLTLERIQYAINNELTEENRINALSVLNRYKNLRGLTLNEGSTNQPEIDLIKTLKKCFSDHKGHIISLNELTLTLWPKNRNLFFFALNNNTVFMNKTINIIIDKVKKELTGESLKMAVESLNKYKKLRRYEKKIEFFNAESKLNEEICRIFFEELFKPYLFPTVSIYTFPWLRGLKGGPMHIDGYNQENNLGFEFNGIQHYEIENLYNKNFKDLESQQKLDSHKDILLRSHNVRCITIPYTVKLKDREEFIRRECDNLGIDISETNELDIQKIEKEARSRIVRRKKNLNNIESTI